MRRTFKALMAAVSMIGITAIAFNAATAQQTQAVGTTRVAQWKDDKKAAFLLMFDDSIPSHVKTVIPELQKRGMGGTFYVNPARGQWQTFKDKWETEIPSLPGMVYGNHTWTHKGIIGVDDAEEEIGKTNATILKLFRGKEPRLISFGRPGVGKDQWKIDENDLQQVLSKHHLIERETFNDHGAMIAFKTAPEMLALADKAIAKGNAEYIVFHGVGAEWISTPVETFTALLDGLVARRDQLWITDHISAHQYETERASAEVKILASDKSHIRLSLQSKADAQFYDLPLTLITQVPTKWRRCEITQGMKKTAAAAIDGKLQFEALPNGEAIVIQPAKK